MVKAQQKRFIVRKYIMASSASDALKKEKTISPDDCFIDDEWVKQNINVGGAFRGFSHG